MQSSFFKSIQAQTFIFLYFPLNCFCSSSNILKISQDNEIKFKPFPVEDINLRLNQFHPKIQVYILVKTELEPFILKNQPNNIFCLLSYQKSLWKLLGPPSLTSHWSRKWSRLTHKSVLRLPKHWSWVQRCRVSTASRFWRIGIVI